MKAILTYHSIDGSGSVISIDRDTFRRHVRWLAGSGIEVVSLDRVLQGDPAGDAVAITFDDGFTNFATEAWPVLRDHGMAVTLFVPTDHAGAVNGWEDATSAIPRMPLLDWVSIAELAGAGVEIGSHSRSHPDLRRLPDDRLDAEVIASADRITAETGRRPTSFAYPYGRLDDRVRTVVAREYRVAVTTELRWVLPDDDPHRLPRLDSYYLRQPGRIEQFGTPSMERYLAVRRGLRAARSLVTRS
ncbi:MAG: polysaccharide deacetylase family protein [Gemmatimonadota bacterium]|jgi:peptidoglycan/xylan/chitin deacetylase (PgdA/CDA1 family)